MLLRQFSGGELNFRIKDWEKYELKNKVVPQALYLKSENHFKTLRHMSGRGWFFNDLCKNFGTAEFFSEGRDGSIHRVGGEANRQRNLQPPDSHDDWNDNLHQHWKRFAPAQSAVDDVRIAKGADHGQRAQQCDGGNKQTGSGLYARRQDSAVALDQQVLVQQN